MTNSSETVATTNKPEIATFGAGCFWCVEAVFVRLNGVHHVVSGYMGGTIVNPDYQAVCSGTTGHAEVVQIQFDPATISFLDLLDWFWQSHDPTTLNRQGADVGTQYRSAIFYHTAAQKEQALRSKSKAAEQFENTIVTEISPAGTFYPAEEYHQNYYQHNSNAPYCKMMIRPKLAKLNLAQ